MWSVVRVPALPDEDARHLHRDLEVLKAERRAHRTRIQSFLFTHGLDQKVGRTFPETLPTLGQWDGQPLPPALQARMVREYQRLQTDDEQIRALEKERQTLLATCGISPTARCRSGSGRSSARAGLVNGGSASWLWLAGC